MKQTTEDLHAFARFFKIIKNYLRMKSLLVITILFFFFGCGKTEVVDNYSSNKLEVVATIGWGLDVYKIKIDSVYYIIASDRKGIAITRHLK